ncbi:2-dehydro-3-deoxygalactonokinase [Propionivibrio dicarboxylicus]|uniref:2-dehydro-3-deoxygalactonokinase n=1 Tax=Propionivibrio dicarboxylicus TaxID=83767 RepID=A0A1G7ZGW3_9RHOO|nr:2-dehydro-3-deoxygalactonokinase [Propionivibrio dicarboxylicus]SDH07340.1 2-dehydro-3-deoxygalactonokinase [Propionivibrio dicarboxylicus]
MTTSSPIAPALLALDWGTSSLRAFLMQDSRILDTRQSAHGIQHLPAPGVAGYRQAFAELVGDWIDQWPQLPVVASGMVGSAQGWREAPYVRCPADIADLASQSVGVDSGMGPEILIAPGVLFDQANALPDVMRGEEIQIAGALLANPGWRQRACMLLPGTHSKWAQIEDGKIVRFTSYLTGELFSVLCRHSILGRLMPDAAVPADDPEAFALGLDTAARSGPGDLSHQIFGTRTLGLTGRLPPPALADYLSGLLIGHELVSGLATAASTGPLVMIGAPALCRRYADALARLQRPVDAMLDNTAPAGLWHLATAAGLVRS